MLRRNIRAFVFTFLVSIFPFAAFSQSSIKDLDRFMTAVKNNTATNAPISILSDTKNETQLLTRLAQWSTDSIPQVRQKAFYFIRRIGEATNEIETKRIAIGLLLTGLRDKDSGIIGSVIAALTHYDRSLFTKANKDTLSNYVQRATPHLPALMMLAGYIDITDTKQKLKQITRSKTAFKNRWAAHLALARMSDNASIQFILDKLKNAEYNDALVYDVVPDLIYTRNPEIFRTLEAVIRHDDPTCESANPDSNKKILCGYRVMEAIAPVIKNFPISSDGDGNLNVSSYEEALLQTRTWLKDNPNYVITNNFY
ncbi:MAG TPA: hypothetical protein VD927_06970 [Chryseosolibacter sp.]|nr:hypothetical protein [Chryseosolibacter sp.]